MRQFIIRVAVLVILIGGASRAFPSPGGAVATRTDARGFFTKPKEPNCTLCHTPDSGGIPSGINDPSGALKILDVPANYVPGTTYTLRVHIEHDWNPVPADPLRWGFQMQAIQASTGDSAGIWVLTPNVSPDSFKVTRPTVVTSVYKNRRYVEQAGWLPTVDHSGGATHQGEPGPVEWRVKWQAPPGDSGKIYFFAAGNSANGDGLCNLSGDYIFTTSESTTAGISLDVPAPPAFITRRDALDPPTPNPMRKSVGLTFTLAKGGVADLAVFDPQGRLVRTILHGYLDAGSHGATWSGKNDRGDFGRNGIYFIRLRTPGQQVISRKVTLAR